VRSRRKCSIRRDRPLSGEAYKLLLEAVLKEVSTFSLVWSDQRPFAPTATAVRKALRGLQLGHVTRVTLDAREEPYFKEV
jgi:hypothetical protein